MKAKAAAAKAAINAVKAKAAAVKAGTSAVMAKAAAVKEVKAGTNAVMVKAAVVKEAKAVSNAVTVKEAVKAGSNAVMAREAAAKEAKAASNAVMTVDRDWVLWHRLCNLQAPPCPAALLPAEITTGTKTAASTAAMTIKPESPYRISRSAYQPMYRRMTILCSICPQQAQPR